jgi:hypothetical protein
MLGFREVVVNYVGHASMRRFADLPLLCPECERHMEPWRLAARSTNADDTRVDFAYQCSRPACRRVFIAHYHLGPDGVYDLDDTTPASLQHAELLYATAR